MKQLVLLFLTLIIALKSFGQDLPLGSKEELRFYAVEQAYQVSGYIGTQLPGEGDGDGSRILTRDTKGLNAALDKLKFTISVANPEAPIHKRTWVFNKDSDTLFVGNGNFWLEKGSDGNYKIPKGFGDIELQLIWEVPLYIPGAQNASVLLFNENGYVIDRRQLKTEDGKVFFPQDLAGKKGILAVLNNSTGEYVWHYYSLDHGKKLVGVEFDMSLKSSVRGILVQETGDYIMHEIETSNGYGEKITFEYHAHANSWLSIICSTTEGAHAKGYWVRTIGTEWKYYPTGSPLTPNRSNVPVEANEVYQIIPVFDTKDLRDWSDTITIIGDGGDKG